MKIIIFLITLITMSIAADSQPVAASDLPQATEMPMFPIRITTNKTTNIIFPYTIKNVDRGVESLLVQKVEGAEHILQLKAASIDMPETNLSVVTADLHLYSFEIRYDSCPHTFNYDFKTSAFGASGYADGATATVHEKLSEGEILQSAKAVSEQKPYISKIKDSEYGIALKLNGVYINKDVLFLSLQLENGTSIGYDIESLQLGIRDQKSGKRTAVQEIPLSKLLAWGDTTQIDSHTGQRLVLAFPKFTIPDKKDCIIQLREANGGRHLECKLGNKQLIRSRQIH